MIEYEAVPAPPKKDYGRRAISRKRRLRKRLCAEHGIASGRQWVKLRKALRRGTI